MRFSMISFTLGNVSLIFRHVNHINLTLFYRFLKNRILILENVSLKKFLTFNIFKYYFYFKIYYIVSLIK